MSECGLKVTFIPHDRVALQPYTRMLQQSGIEVVHGATDIATWLDRTGRYLDCVWMARPAVSHDYLRLVQAKTAARLVYFTHDLHFLRERRRFEVDDDPAARASSEWHEQVETDTFKAVDCVTTPSTDEACVISALAPATPVCVLPLHYFEGNHSHRCGAAATVDRRRDILFVGSDHAPNVDAAVVLVREVMPLVWHSVPDARVTIAGTIQHPAVLALESSRVRLPGYAPDLGPHYDRARMSLSPLRYGAGVKGKILSSLAAGVPVVTTAIGNEGIGLRAGVEALIGESASELAAHAIRLLNDDALFQSLAAAGRRVIDTRYSKATVRDALLGALNLLVCHRCGRLRPARTCLPARGAFACRRCVALTRRWPAVDVDDVSPPS
jgi:glycosyltransferase involved in cell wall biosynthesis